MNDFEYTGRFKDQVAIVAGGARGIGRAIAFRLASEAPRVVIFDVRQSDLDATKKSFDNKGLNSAIRYVDITDESAT